MKPSILSVSLKLVADTLKRCMRNLLFVYNFSAGYLFLMLSFTLTDNVKFQLLAFSNTYLSTVLLPSASKACCVPFLGRCLLHF